MNNSRPRVSNTVQFIVGILTIIFLTILIANKQNEEIIQKSATGK